MASYRLVSELNADRTRVTIKITEDDALLGSIWFEAPELEAVIHQLAEHRAKMAEPVIPELDPKARVETVRYPAWWVTDDPSAAPDHKHLALRHPGLGWIGFLFEQETAGQIGALLRGRPRPPRS